MEEGLIHIYCGNGKGKTTAAIGLSIRAAGNSMKVLFAQFLKSAETGELTVLMGIPGITVARGDDSCEFSAGRDEASRVRCTAAHDRILDEAIKSCREGETELLVLDEAVGAYNRELMDRARLIDFLKNKPPRAEVVLTGRNPSPELMELADYISEIRKIRHPFDRGIGARKGIER